MKKIYSNRQEGDFVGTKLHDLLATSTTLFIAVPYFTRADEVLTAVSADKTVRLLVGLNEITSAEELVRLHNRPNVLVRYLTGKFHAKIFILDNDALLGSSNLTSDGMYSNREATIHLEVSTDFDAFEETRALFEDLWGFAHVLTPKILENFRSARKHLPKIPDLSKLIENAVGIAEPASVTVGSETQSKERLFIESLRQEIWEENRPAFLEVSNLLAEHGLHRTELLNLHPCFQANSFLNWMRDAHIPGEIWKDVAPRSKEERREHILQLGREWLDDSTGKIASGYVAGVRTVMQVFGSPASIAASDKDRLAAGLMATHAFSEQLRFVKGGLPQVSVKFWEENKQDIAHVRKTLSYLVHGAGGDFVERLYDVLNDEQKKLRMFARYCSLELFGTVKPDEYPPINTRMLIALRYIGFDLRVRGANAGEL